MVAVSLVAHLCEEYCGNYLQGHDPNQCYVLKNGVHTCEPISKDCQCYLRSIDSSESKCIERKCTGNVFHAT